MTSRTEKIIRSAGYDKLKVYSPEEGDMHVLEVYSKVRDSTDVHIYFVDNNGKRWALAPALSEMVFIECAEGAELPVNFRRIGQ